MKMHLCLGGQALKLDSTEAECSWSEENPCAEPRSYVASFSGYPGKEFGLCGGHAARVREFFGTAGVLKDVTLLEISSSPHFEDKT